MRRSPILRSACIGALALAAFVGAIPSADAAVYRGRYTPDYGQPFTELYWNGTLEVSVPDTCVPGVASSISIFSCPGMEITEATVNLYNKTDYLNTGEATVPLDTLAFAEAGWSGLNWLLSFDGNGKLVGATSTAFPAIQADGDDTETKYNGQPAYFSLQFLGNYAQLYWFENEPTSAELLILTDITQDCRKNGKTVIDPIWWLGYDGNTCGWSDPDNINSAVGAFITFERVPEPATLALVPAAFGAMGLAGMLAKRRRRRSLA